MEIMRVVKKPTKYLLILLFLLILTPPFLLKLVPSKYFSALVGKSSLTDKIFCNFSTKVSGQSMNPVVAPGTSISLSRCFEKEDLVEGTLVLFNEDSGLRFGIIRHVVPLDPIVYKVSDEKAPGLLHDVVKEEIVGITKDIDINLSGYQPIKEAESFILDSSEFLTDFYLARIPKGAGIETASLEKTTSFSRKEDKFCFVIIPKKNLMGVELEISNIKTGEKVSLGKGIVFSAASKPNINCSDFGSSRGMLNLDPGTYQYRFLMNHQMLADIQFEVR